MRMLRAKVRETRVRTNSAKAGSSDFERVDCRKRAFQASSCRVSGCIIRPWFTDTQCGKEFSPFIRLVKALLVLVCRAAANLGFGVILAFLIKFCAQLVM